MPNLSPRSAPRSSARESSRSGFTLLELIIYVGIFAIAAGLMTGILTTLTRVQVRENASIDVSTQAQFVMQTVQRLVRDASIIELPANASTSTLKLRMRSATIDPTCITVTNGTAYLMQGNDGVNKQSCWNASSSPLTDSKVVVNTLNFVKNSNPPAKDTVQINLTMSYNSTNPTESAISRTLESAIVKVSAATFDSDIIPASDNTYNVGIGAQRWVNGLFSNSLLVGYTSMTGPGGAAFNGNVGIGTSAPSTVLHVNGALTLGTYAATYPLTIYQTGGGAGDAMMYIRNPTTNKNINILLYAVDSGAVLQGSAFGFDPNNKQLFFGNTASNPRLVVKEAGGVIVGDGSGKITAGTIDPLYSIDGTRYATYVPSISGKIREEVTGNLVLQAKGFFGACDGLFSRLLSSSCSSADAGQDRISIIDFDHLEKGSELWLFSRITDFGPHWENLDVILSPGFNGRAWYEKDVAHHRLVIHGNQEGEVTYRLTAARFDHDKWPIVSDATEGGLTVPSRQ
ncbi:MAG: type II secretion system protein [Candidatus Rokubacteria bacterium]|nr:type II secretion system protein [Candidatus Rokubacteria bacterium]